MKSVLLFPTIEHMALSPSGRRICRVERLGLIRPLSVIVFLLCQFLFIFDWVKRLFLNFFHDEELEMSVAEAAHANLFNFNVIKYEIAVLAFYNKFICKTRNF